jgi:hypothetical protein
MKKVLLVIILCLLMRSIANAECAWVLWKIHRFYIDNVNLPESARHTEWSRVVVVTNYKECRMNQLSTLRAEVALSKVFHPDSIDSWEGLEGGPSNITLHFKGGYEVIEFQCFPDTIDPRK